MGPGKKINAAERAHMLRCKTGVCIPCLMRCAAGLLPAPWVQVGNPDTGSTYWGMLEYNHCNSGGIRRGHMYGYGICIWHHHGNQASPPEGYTHSNLRDRYGVSLMDGNKLFKDSYGTDDELIEVQSAYLRGEF